MCSSIGRITVWVPAGTGRTRRGVICIGGQTLREWKFRKPWNAVIYDAFGNFKCRRTKYFEEVDGTDQENDPHVADGEFRVSHGA